MSYSIQHDHIAKSLRDTLAFNPTQYRFCLDEQILTPDQSYVSQNQKLVGGPNPKTLIPPVIIAPPTATDFWSDSHVVPHGINASTNQAVSQSGYLTESSFYWDRPSTVYVCCGGNDGCNKPTCSKCAVAPPHAQKQLRGFTQRDTSPQQIEGYHSGHKFVQQPQHSNRTCGVENYKPPSPEESDEWRRLQCSTNPMACKGDPILYESNSKANLPINRMVGDCYRTEQMSSYNQELYTNTIEPGIYTRSSVVEPIQSNIGISHTEQFEPLTLRRDGSGLLFEQLPHSTKIPQPSQESENYPNTSNIYDPRLTGYGTSYRGYNNELLGQPDFYYDDVDSVRRPNYVVRSNIDHNQWAEQYGPMNPRAGGCIPYAEAQNQFIADTGAHRTEMQERLLRKYNTQIGWQRREAPIRRDGRSNFTYR